MTHPFARRTGHRPALLGLIPVALATGALVAACGSSSAPSAAPAPAATSAAATSAVPTVETPATTAAATAAAASGEAVIHIKDFMYTAPTNPISAGSKFMVINDDSVAHTYEDVNGAFDSGTVKPGASVTVTAPKAGTYKVKCDFHPNMHGTLVVT